MRIILLSLLVACTHAAPVAAPANHAIEFIALLDKSVRCEDWRTFGTPVHSALCASGDSLLWCVATPDAKPHCDVLWTPPAKDAAKVDHGVAAPPTPIGPIAPPEPKKP